MFLLTFHNLFFIENFYLQNILKSMNIFTENLRKTILQILGV
jgi:hypothetical protein